MTYIKKLLFLIIALSTINMLVQLFITVVLVLISNEEGILYMSKHFHNFSQIWPLVCSSKNFFGLVYLPYSIIIIIAASIGFTRDRNITDKLGEIAIHLLRYKVSEYSSKNINTFGKYVVFVLLELLAFAFTLIYAFLCFRYREIMVFLPYPANIFFAEILCVLVLPILIFMHSFAHMSNELPAT